ncbi:MAG: ATP-binding protein [Myxococcota bacterium]|jgi:predicted ATPase|nr:ATP-binding protein [Myxococcota bacterium]
MIESFTVSNFGCVRNASAKLTPLHAFIGPNDSGKSTVLRALQWAAGWRSRGLPPQADGASKIEVALARDGLSVRFRTTRSQLNGTDRTILSSKPLGEFESQMERLGFGAPLGIVELVRFDADRLREPSLLLSRTKLSTFVSSRGAGLPAVLMDIRGRPDDLGARIEQRFRARFPYVKGLSLPPTDDNRVALELVTIDGKTLSTSQLSEGLLYYLAFEALRHVEDVKLLLVEEPENGLHPARIAEVVKVLREISDSGTQVVMATHSPLVINELGADEVTLVTRPSVEEGTRLTPMRATRNFEQRSKVYALGELWLAYADGDTEAQLVSNGSNEDAAQ